MYFSEKRSPMDYYLQINKIKEKQKILHNANIVHDDGISIWENYCKDTMSVRKKLLEQVLNYGKQDKIVYLNYLSIFICNK